MIKDLQNFESITEKFLLTNRTQSLTKTGSEYLRLDFQDSSGEISSFVFDHLSQYEDLQIGKVYEIDGFTKLYKDQLNLVISSIEVDEDADPRDYQAQLDISFDEMIVYIESQLMSITSQQLLNLTLGIYQKHKETFFYQPAAKKIHHNFQGGLLYHTYAMLKDANALMNVYQHLNKDVIISTIILHDIGKCVELSNDFSAEYTDVGKLIGHISILDGELNSLAKDYNYNINQGELLHLRHALLAHHGKEEWGSPVKPQTLEAIFIHLIDQFDATMQMAKQAQFLADHQWSEKIWSLDNRQLFKFD